MEEKDFTQIVEFVNYLHSTKRNEMLLDNENVNQVTDADLANFFGDDYVNAQRLS